MGWQEPGKQGNGQDGPPDLDAAWRDFRRKLKRSFGGGSSDGGDGEGSGSAWSITWIFGVILALWFFSGIFIVQPAEEAVILRFGRYVETVGPGLHWVPRLIDSVYKRDVQEISNFTYSSDMLTEDANIVLIELAVQYRIGNIRDYLFNVVNPEQTIRQATASALRQVIGHTTLDDVLTKGRELVRKETFDQLNVILKLYNTGLLVTDVVVQPAKPPEEVKSAFDDAIKALEDEQRFINQGQSYARRVLPIAKGKAQRLVYEGEAYKQKVTLNAEGDVARFNALLKAYEQAPKVTRERLYLDAVEEIFMNTSKILVDVKSGNNLLYLPLDRILKEKNVTVKRVNTSSTNGETSTSTTRSISRSGRPLARLGRESYRGRGEY